MDLVLQIQINDHIYKFHSETEKLIIFMLICYSFVVYSATVSASILV